MQGYLSAIIVIGAFVAFYGFIYLTALIMKWSSNLDGDDDANDLNAPLVDGYELPYATRAHACVERARSMRTSV